MPDIKKILFLHEDTRLCAILKPVLEAEGYALVAVADGEEPAVAVAREQPEFIWADAVVVSRLLGTAPPEFSNEPIIRAIPPTPRIADAPSLLGGLVPGASMNLPVPGASLNLPVPGASLNPPVPGASLNPPVPGASLNPPVPGASLNPPVPGASLNPPVPGASLNPPVPGALLNPPVPGSPQKANSSVTSAWDNPPIPLSHQPIAGATVVTPVIGGPLTQTSTPQQPATRLSSEEQEKLRDFQNMFLILKTKYARTLPERVAGVENAIAQARYFPGEKKHEEVIALAHKIVGTASNYGFTNLAGAMRYIEDAGRTLPTLTPVEKEQTWADIETQIEIAKEEAGVIAVDVAEAVQSLPAAQSQPSDRTHPALSRLLVMDTDDEFLSLLEQLCIGSQIDVVKANTPDQALAKACLHTLDAALIVVQEKSPDSSFKLARELRELPGYDNLPLAFMSNASVGQDKVEAAHSGGSIFLDKSITPEALQSSVQYLVSIRQSRRPKILVVDDDQHFADAVALVLRQEGCLVHTLTDATKVLDVLTLAPPDMMLLDVLMPAINGFEVCKIVRAVPRWRELPIIFLTAQTDVNARVAAFRSGGDDYLPKPVINEELLARVRVRLDHARLLRERSDRDSMTGLLLRRPFMEQVNGLMAEAERKQSVLSICLLNIDHFPHLCQTYGHLAGDRVLAGLGHLLGKRFRADDLRGRWAGEQFILAFKHANKQTLEEALARLNDEFQDIPFEGGERDQFFRTSFSWGLASYPDDAKSIAELLAGADKQLDHAREEARQRPISSQDDRRVASKKP